MLGEATKKETVLRKAAVGKKNFYKKDSSGSSKDPRKRSRSRSRSRSPRKERSRAPRYNAKKRKSSGGGGDTKDKKQKKDANKSKGILPEIVTDVWSNFLTPAAIMLVTSLGIVTAFLPKLEAYPLGGRIQYFIDNWRKVTDNQWVLSVVEFGYKIPLKFLPFQKRVPKNPPATGSAHSVLVNEAIDLKKKHAVSVVK